MAKVRHFTYRRAPTAKGLESIEKDKVELYDPTMYANFNSGVLEQYLDEKARTTSFKDKQWFWKKVIVGILIGVGFAVFNQYVGLKIGMIVSGAWYLSYIIGLALRWKPAEINIVAGACTGASATCTGFVFTYPAIYLLAYHEGYIGEGGARLITPETIPTIQTALVAAIIAGFLGTLYFIIFRRIWLVEDPLPCPGFEGTIKLLDIAHDVSAGAIDKAKKALKVVIVALSLNMAFSFLKEFPIMPKMSSAAYVANRGENISVLDHLLAHQKWYLKGDVLQPYETDVLTYTHVGFGLSPMMLAVGWFMKFKIAFLMSSGTLLTWFVVVPLALGMKVPIYWPSHSVYYAVSNPVMFLHPEAGVTPAIVAYAKIGRIIAIGAILGGGITALLKMARIFKTSAEDIFKLKGAERRDWVEGKGWYEWPMIHIPVMAVVVIIGCGLIFVAGGFPVAQSFAFSTVLAVLTFFLGAIAVKTMGEVRSTPVSGTSFITLMVLVGIFTLMGTPPAVTLAMALIGTTVFGTAITLSADITWDFKMGNYCGTRPYYLIKGELSGILPGAIISAIAATIMSYGLATGTLTLVAPQAHAFATFSQIIMGGKVPYDLLLLGFGIGVFAELITGMGTAFGLGMYLPLSVTLPILAGGIFRDVWEKKSLEPKVKRYKWDERTKTMKIIDTYMLCYGLIIGEAIMGTIVALYLVLPMLIGGG